MNISEPATNDNSKVEGFDCEKVKNTLTFINKIKPTVKPTVKPNEDTQST